MMTIQLWPLAYFTIYLHVGLGGRFFVSGQWYGGKRKNAGYTGKSYPDIRGQRWGCGEEVGREWRKTSFVCDPDALLNSSQGQKGKALLSHQESITIALGRVTNPCPKHTTLNVTPPPPSP